MLLPMLVQLFTLFYYSVAGVGPCTTVAFNMASLVYLFPQICCMSLGVPDFCCKPFLFRCACCILPFCWNNSYMNKCSLQYHDVINNVCMQDLWRLCGSKPAGQGAGNSPPPPSTLHLTAHLTSTSWSSLTSSLAEPLSKHRSGAYFLFDFFFFYVVKQKLKTKKVKQLTKLCFFCLTTSL